MKILYIGVFDTTGKSTNTSQLMAFKSLGHDVVGYNYKQKALLIGSEERDKHLYSLVEQRGFDLVVFSKCNFISVDTFKKISKLTKTCLWFMDPLSTLKKHPETIEAAGVVDYFCCDKKNVLSEVLRINKNSFHVCEGFDQEIEFPHVLSKEYDISFIGNLYGDRESFIKQIEYPVEIINNAFGRRHAKQVSKTKINLNLCTSRGSSDRIYKILASGGFLLSDEWDGRSEDFIDTEDLVIFKNIDDLNEKIQYYLGNPEERQAIANSGFKKVQKFNRLNWAKKIIESFYKINKK